MKRTHLAALILIASSVASAHNVWIRPSSTQLSGEKDYVTIDNGASDFPFDVNHRGRPAENLHAYAPDGKEIEKENLMAGKLRTSYDAKLTQQGTHRFTDELHFIQFNYDDGGKSVRWRGSPEKYQKENPMADKKREKYKQLTLNTETFVTLGEPTADVLKPAAKGLDLEYLTHPNELYAGETAKFRAVYDGKPLANARVRLAKDGMRYRTHDFIELKKRRRRPNHHRLAGRGHVLAFRRTRSAQRHRQGRAPRPRIRRRAGSPAALKHRFSQKQATRQGGFFFNVRRILRPCGGAALTMVVPLPQ